MSTSIPYDPSLALASIVPVTTMKTLQDIAKEQAPIEAAEDELNAAILALRSFDMTINQMSNMGILIDDATVKQRGQAATSVKNAAGKLLDARIQGLQNISKLRGVLGKVQESYESPVDFNRTQIRRLPLSASSLKMDAQYFSFDKNDQAASSSMFGINAFVSGAAEILGHKTEAELTASVSGQVAKQREIHNIIGTLIITATCTHKDAVLLAPFVLDVDKAIRVWNSIFKDDEKKMIKTNSLAGIQKIAEEQETKDEPTINIISGATYASCFVGMVHILKAEDTSTNQNMISMASSLQAQMETGAWFKNTSGGFGVDTQFANDVKRLLSTQDIKSHISIDTMGAIPSIKSNEVQLGVKTFADFDPAKMMDKLATLANATTTDQRSVQQGAQAARTGQQMVQIRASEVQSVVTGLSQVDDQKNKMLDINSLMGAFEDYVQQALAGNIGVPVTYYLRPITRSQLAQMWVAKYFPGKYLTAAGDNTGNGSKPSAANSPSVSEPSPAAPSGRNDRS